MSQLKSISDKLYLTSVLIFLLGLSPLAQAQKGLFKEETAINLKISLSVNELRKSGPDTVFKAVPLEYLDKNGEWQSLPVNIRARGHSRRSICQFPPIRLTVKKAAAKKTPFKSDRKLKIVLPCKEGDLYQQLIQKEFICYKLYETLTPYHFQTREINLTLVDQRNRKDKEYEMRAFFLEVPKSASKRFKGNISSSKLIFPNVLEDTTAIRQDFFAFMIGNTDWSNTSQHNVKVLERKGLPSIPLAYDFDMAGLVEAPYAKPYDYLPISSVKERLYRGVCRDPALIQYVKNQFLQQEEEMFMILDQYGSELPKGELALMKRYMTDFYKILKDDGRFKEEILDRCEPMPPARRAEAGL